MDFFLLGDIYYIYAYVLYKNLKN